VTPITLLDAYRTRPLGIEKVVTKGWHDCVVDGRRVPDTGDERRTIERHARDLSTSYIATPHEDRPSIIASTVVAFVPGICSANSGVSRACVKSHERSFGCALTTLTAAPAQRRDAHPERRALRVAAMWVALPSSLDLFIPFTMPV
jgi:hypothetical protein